MGKQKQANTQMAHSKWKNVTQFNFYFCISLLKQTNIAVSIKIVHRKQQVVLLVLASKLGTCTL